MIDKLGSPETRKVIDPINTQLEELLKTVAALKAQVGQHKIRIRRTIQENQKSINGSLKSAGYRYTVAIVTEPDSYKMRLIHDDLDEHIEMASRHLRYGERNSFALVLFMHEVNNKKPSPVVLDDPISSIGNPPILREAVSVESKLLSVSASGSSRRPQCWVVRCYKSKANVL
uniref:hypothetical protein n=1 Tax=Celeribacter sp. TaxID=1890673 RepID=UPI003A942BA7